MEVDHYDAITVLVATLHKLGVTEPETFREALFDTVRQHVRNEEKMGYVNTPTKQKHIEAMKYWAVMVGFNSSYLWDPQNVDMESSIPEDFGGKASVKKTEVGPLKEKDKPPTKVKPRA
jgi:hypothetical protein